MFRFESPEYFYLLLVLPIMILLHYWSIYWRKRRIRKYGDPELLKLLISNVSRIREEVKFWLVILALSSFVFALARPQYGTHIDTRERRGIEAIIAMDVSNSMLAEDVRPNRLEKSKMLVNNLVEGMNDDKVGMIVYAGQAFVQLPITNDYVSAKMFLESMSPSMVSIQGTDIAAAIELSMHSFTQDEDVSRAIFLITDGEDNEGGAVEAAREAAEHGVRVYVLGVGSPEGSPVPMDSPGQYMIDEQGNTVITKLNEAMCEEIAQAGNGAYIYVNNSSSAQKELESHVNKLAKQKLEGQVYSEYDEQFQGFLLLGLFFLFLDVLILERQNNWLRKFSLFGNASKK